MKTTRQQRITTSIADDGRRNILTFLKRNPIGTICTVTPDGDPHGAVIYYSVDDEFIIGFATKQQTRKYDNLVHNDRAMLVVYEALSQTTVQVMGVVEEITDDSVVQRELRNMLKTSIATGEPGLPPVSKLNAGRYVALRLRPVQIRMAVYARPDPGGVGTYESIEFNP